MNLRPTVESSSPPDLESEIDEGRRPGARLLAIPALEVVPTKPEWLAEGWLLRRALHLIVGRQGAGKTTFAAWLVSLATTGTALPGGTKRQPLRAAVLSLEEPRDRVVARLGAAGTDLGRVTILGEIEDEEDGRTFLRRWQIPRDIRALGAAISAHEIDLVIVDGLGFSIAGDSHNYSVVGSALAALAGEADRTGSCIVGLTHPPKGASDAVTAAIGSTAWTAIPRISMVLGIDPADPGRRVVRVAKTNYREPDAGISFALASNAEYEVGYVAGVRLSDVPAEQLTTAPATAEEKTERSEARDFLLERLADGPLPSEEVIRAAEDVGISKRTLERARKELGVVSRRRSDPDTGRAAGWEMTLHV